MWFRGFLKGVGLAVLMGACIFALWYGSVHLLLGRPWWRLVGLALVVGGMLGFLPVLGFWMIPLGLVIMFFEVPWVRERWRQARAWWKAWRAGNGTGGTPSV